MLDYPPNSPAKGEFAANGFVGAGRFQIDYFSLSKFVAGIIPVST